LDAAGRQSENLVEIGRLPALLAGRAAVHDKFAPVAVEFLDR
jgi:hypothetical protein